MQCPDCGYICFKQAKDCGNCGFNFKKAATSAASLFRNDSFTIFAGSKTPEKGQESSAVTASADSEDIAVMDHPEDSQENPELESGEFLLNLSDADKNLLQLLWTLQLLTQTPWNSRPWSLVLMLISTSKKWKLRDLG